MVKVLWISNRPLNSEAIKVLKKLYGQVTIDVKKVIFSSKEAIAFDEFKRLYEEYDLVGGAIPIQIWFNLLTKHDFHNPVLGVVHKNKKFDHIEIFNK
ncbi:MAG: hypothetical protein QXV17_01580 [Candidatus Micrarchaeaceae archaeon]